MPLLGMAMNEECVNYQSRTYASGEVARFCRLGLAPEAPWRCPEACPSYRRRMADVGWVHGSLIEPPVEDEPATGPDVVALLADAEAFVDAVATAVLEDQLREDQRKGRRLFRRRR